MMTRIFLSGGLHTKWQRQVISACPHLAFFDPSDNGLAEPIEYAVWDLTRIRQCIILFGYVEHSNPSGFGLAAEVGYAKGLGKTVILVDEKSSHDKEFAYRFQIVREMADICFDRLEDGIAYLTSFEKSYPS